MKTRPFRSSSPVVEPLEARIAPALAGVFSPTVAGTAILLDADPTTVAPQGLSATQDGPFLLYVEKGSALVFTKDLNLNGRIDFNEITGIAAGDGLSLLSFVDIHGDIVTNLRPDGTLTDSDNDASNGRDGQILLNSHIDKIVLRSVTAGDLQAGEPISDKIALSSYSIFGNIYAGGGFGTADGKGGLIIDDSGSADQALAFTGVVGNTIYVAAHAQIGSIRVGTAASGEQFGFGASSAEGVVSGISGADVRGVLQNFIPPANTSGADINGVHATNLATLFSLNTLQAGDGGFNGRGGNVSNVTVNGDFSGGYSLIAGNAGTGPTGPTGGSILNYSDLSSIAGGEILLQTGNGGNGLLKRGGDGGSLTLDPAAPINTAGHIVIELGDGGSGLTGGGNGGSQPAGTFTTPETVVPYGLTIVSSTHSPGDIYNQKTTTDPSFAGPVLINPTPLAPGSFGYHATRGFDFNGDGINDAVYSTKQSDQLIVLLGDGLGGFGNPSTFIYLNNPANAQGVTVGDFNGDGHPDVATASADPSYGGVTIFLSKYDSLTGNFQGFTDAVSSPLPSVGGVVYGRFDDPVLVIGKQTAYTITNLTSGDFDHDGTIDLGVVTTIGLFVLRGDSQDPDGPAGPLPSKASGYFYSDVAANGFIVPVARTINNTFTFLRPTALTDGGPDKLFAANEGAKSILSLDDSAGVLTGAGIGLGKVDTDRKYSDTTKPTPDHISSPLADVTLRDFTVLDGNNDKNADVVALSLAPTGFLITKVGNGAGGFTFTSNREASPPYKFAGENDGIKIGGPDGILPNDASLTGLMAANNAPVGGVRNINGTVNGFTIIDYNSEPGAPGIHLIEFSFGADANAPAPTNSNYVAVFAGQRILTSDPYILTGDPTIRAYDTYVPNSAAPSNVTYSYLQAQKNDELVDFVETFATAVGVGGYVESLEDNTFYATAGHGGNSSNGPGGVGGKLGNTLKIDKTTLQPLGSLSYMFPAATPYEGNTRLIGGDGGNGFTAGGAAGGLSGVSVSYPASAGALTGRVFLIAGDGGDSSNGHAGTGGNLNAVSIASGVYFIAGDGGNGKYGGLGGSVLGNPGALVDTTVTAGTTIAAGAKGDIENAQTAILVVRGGLGGAGTKAGGNGGAISGFTPRFLPIIGGSGGILNYVAGDGGSSVGGAGGRGGSVISSAPVTEGNNLAGDIFVQAGAGGGGKTGGAGGSITDFVNSSAPDISVTSMTFLAGNGGQGIGSNGGAGGAVNQVSVSGTGVGFQYYFDFSQPSTIGTVADAFVKDAFGNIIISPIPYARIVAGNGGNSVGAAGGAGGTLSALTVSAGSASLAAIAGRGGDGLTAGGLGGSVLTTTFGSSGSFKMVVAAGDGGDAYGSAPTAANPLGFGGKDGKGGNGGSITGFSQPIGDEVNVDLIAGNGGNTINSGSTQAAVTKVGNGGSITNAQLTGSIGKGLKPADATVAIRAYNDQSFGQTFADFVATDVVGNPDPFNPASWLRPLTDAVGNVGIVVGAKGRVQDNNHDGILDASSSGINGSLTNVHARSIMSAVAGSVERIASIRVLTNVGVNAEGGALGSDKTVDSGDLTVAKAFRADRGASGDLVLYHSGTAPAILDYLTETDTYVNIPMPGGRLVDGALFADNLHT